MIRTVRAIVLGGLLAALLSCQSANAPAPTPARPSLGDEARLLDLTIADAASVAPDANDTMVVPPSTAGPVVLPVTYPRGVTEDVTWIGPGAGTATLMNAHGQVVFQVGQGRTHFEGDIPAGNYTLRIEAAGESPLLIAVTPAGLTQVRDIQVIGEQASSRGSAYRCQDGAAILRWGSAAAYALMQGAYPNSAVRHRYSQQFLASQAWLVSSFHRSRYDELRRCPQTAAFFQQAPSELEAMHQKVVEGDYVWFYETFSGI